MAKLTQLMKKYQQETGKTPRFANGDLSIGYQTWRKKNKSKRRTKLEIEQEANRKRIQEINKRAIQFPLNFMGGAFTWYRNAVDVYHHPKPLPVGYKFISARYLKNKKIRFVIEPYLETLPKIDQAMFGRSMVQREIYEWKIAGHKDFSGAWIWQQGFDLEWITIKIEDSEQWWDEE